MASKTLASKTLGAKTAGVALAVLLSASSASFAAGLTSSTDTAPLPSTQSSIQHHAMHTAHQPTSRRLYDYAPSGVEENEAAPGPVQGEATNAAGESARYAAIQDCSKKANKWSSSSWQTTQFAAYGTCMAEHGQVE